MQVNSLIFCHFHVNICQFTRLIQNVKDITGPSTATTENHDQLIYSLVNPLASCIAALMLQRKTDYCRELYQEKTPAQTHEHIHKEQSSSLGEGYRITDLHGKEVCRAGEDASPCSQLH